MHILSSLNEVPIGEPYLPSGCCGGCNGTRDGEAVQPPAPFSPGSMYTSVDPQLYTAMYT